MRKKIMTRQLAVSVSEEAWKQILEATNELEVSVSQWIREAIEQKLALGSSRRQENSRREERQ
jgi:predicted HicB family RNase H-like nuclease